LEVDGDAAGYDGDDVDDSVMVVLFVVIVVYLDRGSIEPPSVQSSLFKDR